jgi:molybdopterin-guanine dinucleotide biosynthesis protein A
MFRNISGVILAGGESKRFNGFIKPMIVIDGKTIISRIMDAISDLFDEIIIVTNSPSHFKDFKKYRLINDQFLNVGPLGGIHAALKVSKNEAIFVFAGDMPTLDRGIIADQIDFYNANKCDIVIPAIIENIEPLHGIYKKTLSNLLEYFLNEKSEYSVREFLKNANVQYLQMGMSEKTKIAFTNINSPGDLAPVKNFLIWED